MNKILEGSIHASYLWLIVFVSIYVERVFYIF